MTLSRWRRIATGIAAGVIVLCAALLGSALRADNAGVSVASELRPAVVIPIAEDPVDATDSVEVDTSNDSNTNDSAPEDTDDVAASEAASDGDDPSTATSQDDSAATGDAEPADNGDTSDEESLTEPVQVAGTEDSETSESTETTTDDEAAPATPAEEPAADPAPATPAAPLTAPADGLGTGGGVDDAECALDRLVIYAGARRGGVASSIRAALAQAGFAAGCPAPVTVLASNCPLQFAGVLGAGSGYDPNQSYVAASDAVGRETMTAVMGTVGYAGSQIDILDFGFVNPDRPGEQWMAIFIPPTFDGWQDLASRAGLAPTAQSLCSPSGQLAG